MSAPHTNIEKQERRHAVPLGGMAFVLIFAGVLLVALITWTFFVGGAENEGAVPADATTSEQVDNGVTAVPSE